MRIPTALLGCAFMAVAALAVSPDLFSSDPTPVVPELSIERSRQVLVQPEISPSDSSHSLESPRPKE
ncbi:MAG: hypothetical protein H6686_00220 [Fibrobacteria bacterium]|nr:hypothetical protein [Fibrobacteria bacterium]